MKKYVTYGAIILLIITLVYATRSYQQTKYNNSSEGLKQIFFAKYDDVISYEEGIGSTNYSLKMKQSFFDKTIKEQVNFLFNFYDDYIEEALTNEEKESAEYANLRIYSELQEDGEERLSFYSRENVYEIDNDSVYVTQLHGTIDRTLEIPLFMNNGEYLKPTINEVLYGVHRELDSSYIGKSEDYNAKGEYKPVDSMTQDEIEAELTDMLEESLK